MFISVRLPNTFFTSSMFLFGVDVAPPPHFQPTSLNSKAAVVPTDSFPKADLRVLGFFGFFFTFGLLSLQQKPPLSYFFFFLSFFFSPSFSFDCASSSEDQDPLDSGSRRLICDFHPDIPLAIIPPSDWENNFFRGRAHQLTFIQFFFLPYFLLLLLISLIYNFIE